MNRRQFLQRAGALGGAAVLGGPTLLNGRAAAAGRALGGDPQALLDVPAKESPIDTVVVVMMENRSFDHYLGWLANDERYLERGRSRHGKRFRVDGKTNQRFTAPDGTVVKTTSWLEQPGETNPYQGCGHVDPGHNWQEGRVQRDSGFLASGSGNDTFALGYYEADALPFTSRLAREFTVFDRWHASLLGPTFPNRAYLHSGQTDRKTNALPIAEGGYPWETIWDRFDTAGVPAALYASDLPTTALWGPRLQQYSEKQIDDYFADAEAGNLPNVVFLDPTFFGPNRADDHPLADIRGGQRFLRDVFRAFVESKHWKSGLFVLTYDEWGGFFDHVPPPLLPDDRPSADDLENFGQAGFRVPAVIASPYARRGFVDHHLYDHTSVLRFLEWRFLGAPATGPGKNTDTWFLTARDRNARNLGASLLAEDPDRDVGIDVDVAIAPPNPLCTEAQPTMAPATTPVSLHKHAFEIAFDEGYFDRVGYRVRPSAMAREWGAG